MPEKKSTTCCEVCFREYRNAYICTTKDWNIYAKPLFFINKDTRKIRVSSDTFRLIPSDSWEAFNSHSDSEENYDGENYKTKCQGKDTKVNTPSFLGIFQ